MSSPGPATATGLIPGILAFQNDALYATHNVSRVLKIADGFLDFAFPAFAGFPGANMIAFDPSGVLCVGDPFAVHGHRAVGDAP